MFTFVAGGRQVNGTISRITLVRYFWLRANADESRMLKTFVEGYPQIIAVAQRIALKRGANDIQLHPANFAE